MRKEHDMTRQKRRGTTSFPGASPGADLPSPTPWHAVTRASLVVLRGALDDIRNDMARQKPATSCAVALAEICNADNMPPQTPPAPAPIRVWVTRHGMPYSSWRR